MDYSINQPQSEPISPVDEWRPSLVFADKVSEEVRLVRVVDSLDTTL